MNFIETLILLLHSERSPHAPHTLLLEGKGIDKSVSQCNLREGTPFPYKPHASYTDCCIVLCWSNEQYSIYSKKHEPYESLNLKTMHVGALLALKNEIKINILSDA